MIYHSKFSDNERVEIWNTLLDSREPRLVLGVRSSIFLPFADLGLVIVDEEHETSYKQYDPAPRYHARNAAIVAGFDARCQNPAGYGYSGHRDLFQCPAGQVWAGGAEEALQRCGAARDYPGPTSRRCARKTACRGTSRPSCSTACSTPCRPASRSFCFRTAGGLL